jgi:acetyl esterase/lipase
MRVTTYLLAVWFLLLPGCMAQPPRLRVAPNYADLPYEAVASSPKMDLYLPTGAGPFPTWISIHGGAFRFGDKGMVDRQLGEALLNAGYAIASIDYRLSGEATFPAALQDAKAAVRFLRANAAKYKLDPNRFVAFGFSAGGNLAAMLGVTGDRNEFDDSKLGNPGVSSRVQAVVDWFGPTDFSQMDTQAREQGCDASGQHHSDADSPESLYLGKAVSAAPELVKTANPITYVKKGLPPFLIQNGAQDCTVPVKQSKMLADALSAAGADVHYDMLPNVGHGDRGTAVFQSPENLQRLLLFLKSKLK